MTVSWNVGPDVELVDVPEDKLQVKQELQDDVSIKLVHKGSR